MALLFLNVIKIREELLPKRDRENNVVSDLMDFSMLEELGISFGTAICFDLF